MKPLLLSIFLLIPAAPDGGPRISAEHEFLVEALVETYSATQDEPPADLCPGGCCDLPQEPAWDAEPTPFICSSGFFLDHVAYTACAVAFNIEEFSAETEASDNWSDTLSLWSLLVSNMEQAYDDAIADDETSLERWETYAEYSRALCEELETFSAVCDSIELGYQLRIAIATADFMRCANDACRNFLAWPQECGYKPNLPPELMTNCLLAATECGDGTLPEPGCLETAHDAWSAFLDGQAATHEYAWAERVVDYKLEVGYWVSEYEAGNIDCGALGTNVHLRWTALMAHYAFYQGLMNDDCAAAQGGFTAEVETNCCGG